MPTTPDQRYEFHEEIGQGGMAVVYRGLDLKFHREVAIKVLRPELTGNKNVVSAFHSEAAAISRLSHPNIINLYDSGALADRRLYMVIELLRGRSLATILEEHRTEQVCMPWPRLVDIATQVCAALSSAHAHGIIHHDITPGNIFCVGGQGIRGDHVKVVDFGIAKITEMTQAVTIAHRTRQQTAGGLKGTPFYIAPEMLRGLPTDHRVDIYGLGAVMYEMCTGLRPFNQQGLWALLESIARAPLIPPTAANPNCQLPPEAEAVILAAMQREPNDRPQTADALSQLLEATLYPASAPNASSIRIDANRSATNIGLDLTLPHVGPPPGFIAQPLPSSPAKLVTGPVVAVPTTAPQPGSEGLGEPSTTVHVLARPSQRPSLPTEGRDESSTTVHERPSRSLWLNGSFGLGLGLGLAVLAGMLIRPWFFPPETALTPSADDRGAVVPVGPADPVKSLAPVATIKSKEQVEADRLAGIKAQLSDTSKIRDCMKKQGALMGVAYALPITVDVAADGHVTAKHNPEKKVDGAKLLSERYHPCVLSQVQGDPFPPADHPVQLRYTVVLEK